MPKFLSNVNLQKNELQNARIQNLGTAPSSPVSGQIYYDTVGNLIYVWNGTTWVSAVAVDATTSTKGIIQLAGDLTGTAALPTIANLAVTAAKIANTTITIGKIDTTSVTLSSIGAPTADVPWNSKKITGLLDPTSAQDAATKNYVDSNGNLASDWKQSVRVVATTNGTLATAYANGQVVDGVTLATGDRILLTAQTTTSENGIYVVAASGAPTRSGDGATSTQLTVGAEVPVESGTANQFTTWRYTSGAFTAQVWTPYVYVGGHANNIISSSTTTLQVAAQTTLNLIGSTNTVSVNSVGLGLNGRTAAAALDLASSTAAAGGIAFGANEFQVYRDATQSLTIGATTTKVGTLAATTLSGTPNFSGAATGQTAAVDTNTTQLATTAFVVGQAGSATPIIDGTGTVGTSLRYARQDHIHPTDTTRSPLAGSASITTVGTITSGVWNGTALTAGFVPALNSITAPTGDVSLNSHKITNLLDPTVAQDAATKNYVDNAVTGLDAKASVVAATVGTETFTVAAGAVTVIAGTTLDGISPSVGDRILVKDAPAASGTGSVGSSQPGNGIYTVTNATTNLTISRATDMDVWTEVPSSYTWIEKGTANGDTGWVVTSDQGGTINSTAITWTQFTASTVITAGNGLTKSGSVISVLLNGGGVTSGLAISGSGINVAALGITNAMIAASTIDLTTKVTNTLPLGNGGTGQTTAKAARETGLSAAGYFTVTGSGTATSFTVTQATHGLRSSRWLVGQVQDVTTGEVEFADITVNSSGDVTFTFAASTVLTGFQFTIIG